MTGSAPSSMSRCNHCDATKTVCWRKGPSTKPVLCNACGVRYLAKGVNGLLGYLPGHTPRRFKKKDTIRPAELQAPTSPAAWRLSPPTAYHSAFAGPQAPILVDAATQTQTVGERPVAVAAQPRPISTPRVKVAPPIIALSGLSELTWTEASQQSRYCVCLTTDQAVIGLDRVLASSLHLMRAEIHGSMPAWPLSAAGPVISAMSRTACALSPACSGHRFAYR